MKTKDAYSLFRSGLILVIAGMIWLSPRGVLLAEEFLNTGEVSAIAAGSGSIYWLSHELRSLDSNRTPLIHGSLPFEASIQRWLGGECRAGKRNFLDDRRGSAFTPMAFGLLLLVNDLSWTEENSEKETLQDMFLYAAGLTTTAGLTHTAKAVFSRERPYVTLGPSDNPIRQGFLTDRTSFFSGHTSSAFFAATFLNLRLRATMRTQLSPSEYKNWQWAPPTLTYGWATVVGLSRIHAYKHYLSDVLVGALAGHLLAELFFSFSKPGDQLGPGPDDYRALMRVRFSF